MRRFAAVALAVPLMALGVVAAHWVAYLIAVPDAGSRSTLLAATGHAYAAWLPMAVGALGSLAVLLLGALILGGGSSLKRVRLRPGLFLALPPIAFALQEHAERLRVGYGSPWHVWQEPTFWRGLLLQLPFGLVAYLIATLLLRTARAIERVVERRRAGPPIAVSHALRITFAAPSSPRLARRIRCGDALRFRGPPVGLRACL